MCRVTKAEENICVFHSLGLESGSFLLSGKKKQHHSAGLVAANVKARVYERPSESERMRERAAKHPEHERLNGVFLSAVRSPATQGKPRGEGRSEASPAKPRVEIQVRLCTAWFKSSALPLVWCQQPVRMSALTFLRPPSCMLHWAFFFFQELCASWNKTFNASTSERCSRVFPET